MKRILSLLFVLAPVFLFGQISVNKTDSSLNALFGSNLVKWKPQDWTLRVRDTALAHYIPISQKGVANGVAALDAGGKVPVGQLPVQPNLVGEWDAATNTPSLSDGTGTANAMYAVSVAGTRDLGSGSLVFSVGDWVAYASDNKWHLIPHGTAAIGANPSVAVGLTAKNGVSPNFMRADAAPALDQAIAPTWTGAHIFNVAATNTVPTVTVGGNDPQFEFSLANGAADTKRWNWWLSAGNMTFRTLNDAGAAASNIWQVTRTGSSVTEQQWSIAGVQKLNLVSTYFQVNTPTIGVTGADGVKLWLAKYTGGTGHNNAPTAIGATSNYLQIGGREYGNNGFGGIGFGYVSAMTDHPCVWVGYEEKNTAGNTSGDFLVATRNATSNTPPAERFRISSTGEMIVNGDSGTVGQVLTSNGPGQPPTWGTPSTNLNFNGNFAAPATHSGQGDINIEPSSAMVHFITATTGDIFVRLEPAPAGTVKTIKRMDASAHGFHITGDVGGNATVEGLNDIGIGAQNSFRTLISDGTNWWIIGSGGS